MAAQTILDMNPAYQSAASVPEPDRARVLIADDQPDIRFALSLLLRGAGYEVGTADGPEAVVSAVAEKRADLVVMDLNYTRCITSGGEGLNLIGRIRALDSALPILAMTAWGSIDLAVDAMRRGAADFVQKPWSTNTLLEKVRSLLDLRRAARQARSEEEAEVGAAVEIQRKLLSFEAPDSADCEISGMSRTLRFVGGDYCKVDQLGARRFGISIADVAGKGVPGAMLAASLRAAQKPLLDEALPPAAMCAAVNAAMAEITPVGKFISFFYGVLDFDARTLSYSNGGHNPPLLVRADAEVLSLAAGGAVLGYFPEWTYEQAEVPLQPGDRLVLFTDGILEAENGTYQEFGAERLARFARHCRHLSASVMQRTLLSMVSNHCEGSFQDDATLVVIAIR
jgi:sigma-B regulation protein RsbU (phosphoserine phosphatase)